MQTPSDTWTGWAIALAIAVPVVLVVLTEILGSLTRRGSAAAKPVRLLRNWVVGAQARCHVRPVTALPAVRGSRMSSTNGTSSSNASRTNATR